MERFMVIEKRLIFQGGEQRLTPLVRGTYDTIEKANQICSYLATQAVYDLDWTVTNQQDLANRYAIAQNRIKELEAQLKLYQS